MPPSMMMLSSLSSSSEASSSSHARTSSDEGAAAAESSLATTSDEDSSDSDPDEKICEAISFIQAKQSLLQRAAQIMRQEEAFDASNVVQDMADYESCRQQQQHAALGSQGPASPSSDQSSADSDSSNHNLNSDIWIEARDLLISMLSPEDTPALEEFALAPVRKRCLPNPSHPFIDSSLVQMIRASSYVDKTASWQNTQFLTTLPSSVFGKGQWMARALLWGEPCQRSVNDCSWHRFYDPYSCSGGLIPPKNMSMKHAVDLQEAMAVTDEPRLLTQAAPPFFVVHVNRAFLLLAGVGDCAKPHSMVGRPVEFFFQVTQVVGPPEDKQQNYLESILSLEEDKRLTCRIKIIPVMDRQNKRRRLSVTQQSRLYSCMSHVLIKVKEVSEHVNEHSSRCPTPLIRKTSSESLDSANSTSSSDSSDESLSHNGPSSGVVSAVG